VGALLAAALAAGMRSMLLGVAPLDAVSFCAAAGLLILIVLLASLVPARRASAVQPMEALRSE
jgi:ABC-type lipoprotein release transport system permease subunit